MMDDKSTSVFDIGAEDAFVALFAAVAVAAESFVALFAAVAAADNQY